MFSGCLSLKKLNISNFKIDNAISMRYMFFGYNSLKKLYLSSLTSKNVFDMDYMFNKYKSLETLEDLKTIYCFKSKKRI